MTMRYIILRGTTRDEVKYVEHTACCLLLAAG
jgi:hypothetical protein